MSIEVPKSAKIYTTKYSDFRGVDFTNDPTGVWQRRSPNGRNMVPDSSGRPYKRTGWKQMYSVEDFVSILAEKGKVAESVEIYKSFYFELAGRDHILIFTDNGIFRIIENEDGENELSYLDGSDDYDCYTGYTRAFFFEGGGKSAFYVYGNYKIWIYEYEDGAYRFRQETDTYIPTVLIGTNASTCSGTVLEGYNLLGTKAYVTYGDCELFLSVPSRGELIVNVNKETYSSAETDKVVTLTYRSGVWKKGDTVKNLGALGITIASGTPIEHDTITIINGYGVLLPKNVAQDQIGDVRVWVSSSVAFDTELTVIESNSTQGLSANRCALYTDTTSDDAKAWILFGVNYQAINPPEDFIKVQFPTQLTRITNVNFTAEATPTLIY